MSSRNGGQTKDHLGNTRLLADEQGQKIGSWKYYPFGQEAESSSGAQPRQKFTGHERDAEVGLDYMRVRYYGSGLARFLSVDPGDDIALENAQSWNTYAYVRNSPIRMSDPTGQYGLDGGLIKVEHEYATGTGPRATALTGADVAAFGEKLDRAGAEGAKAGLTGVVAGAAFAQPEVVAVGGALGFAAMLTQGAGQLIKMAVNPTPETKGAVAATAASAVVGGTLGKVTPAATTAATGLGQIMSKAERITPVAVEGAGMITASAVAATVAGPSKASAPPPPPTDWEKKHSREY